MSVPAPARRGARVADARLRKPFQSQDRPRGFKPRSDVRRAVLPDRVRLRCQRGGRWHGRPWREVYRDTVRRKPAGGDCASRASSGKTLRRGQTFEQLNAQSHLRCRYTPFNFPGVVGARNARRTRRHTMKSRAFVSHSLSCPVAALAAPRAGTAFVQRDRKPPGRHAAAKSGQGPAPPARAPVRSGHRLGFPRGRRSRLSPYGHDGFWRRLQLRSATRSSFLLRIQERPRNATSITMPRPDEASFMSFSETWPKA